MGVSVKGPSCHCGHDSYNDDIITLSQLVEQLPSKCKDLSSNPSTAKNLKKIYLYKGPDSGIKTEPGIKAEKSELQAFLPSYSLHFLLHIQ
jgi:hypothetical protein